MYLLLVTTTFVVAALQIFPLMTELVLKLGDEEFVPEREIN